MAARTNEEPIGSSLVLTLGVTVHIWTVTPRVRGMTVLVAPMTIRSSGVTGTRGNEGKKGEI